MCICVCVLCESVNATDTAVLRCRCVRMVMLYQPLTSAYFLWIRRDCSARFISEGISPMHTGSWYESFYDFLLASWLLGKRWRHVRYFIILLDITFIAVIHVICYYFPLAPARCSLPCNYLRQESCPCTRWSKVSHVVSTSSEITKGLQRG
jgi:hypothetical protein